MGIQVSVEVPGATQEELKSLAARLPKAGKLEMKPWKDSLLFWKWKGFLVQGLVEGFEESRVAKNENWQLNPETRKSFHELIHAFSRACPRIFSIYVAEAGELPKRESELELPELLDVIETGLIGNRVTYRVRKLPPKILEEEPLAQS